MGELEGKLNVEEALKALGTEELRKSYTLTGKVLRERSVGGQFRKPKGAKDKMPGRCAASTDAIRDAKRDLRLLALTLQDGDNEHARKKIRRTLEVLSLLYACKEGSGQEFRMNVALAVDLSGWKQQGAVKGKEAAMRLKKRRVEAEDIMERTRLVEKEQEGIGKRQEF